MGIKGKHNQVAPGLSRRAKAAAAWMWSTRRRRSARVLARNALWVDEAQHTPSLRAR